MNERLLKSSRLLKRRQFLSMTNRSTRIVGKLVIIDYKPNHLNFSRLGISVTKRYGSAVMRNRFKRIVREAYRRGKGKLPVGLDFNIRPRSASKQASSEEMLEELIFIANNI